MGEYVEYYPSNSIYYVPTKNYFTIANGTISTTIANGTISTVSKDQIVGYDLTVVDVRRDTPNGARVVYQNSSSVLVKGTNSFDKHKVILAETVKINPALANIKLTLDDVEILVSETWRTYVKD